MPTLTRIQRSIRFNLESGTAVELFTNQAPRVPRGNDVALLIGLFNRGAPLDLSNLASLRVEIAAGVLPASARLVTKDLDAEDLTALITKATFGAGVAAHATVNLTADEMNPGLGGALEKQYQLIVTGVTAAGTKLSYGSCPFVIFEDGADAGANPPPEVAPPTYLNTAQVNALIDAKIAAAGGGGGGTGDGIDKTITSLVGGGAAALDGVATAALVLPQAKLVIVGGVLRGFQLVVDAASAADGDYVVRPVDFHAVNNPRQWKSIL